MHIQQTHIKQHSYFKLSLPHPFVTCLVFFNMQIINLSSNFFYATEDYTHRIYISTASPSLAQKSAAYTLWLAREYAVSLLSKPSSVAVRYFGFLSPSSLPLRRTILQQQSILCVCVCECLLTASLLLSGSDLESTLNPMEKEKPVLLTSAQAQKDECLARTHSSVPDSKYVNRCRLGLCC